MKKKQSHAFSKDVYLLGVNKYNEYTWLEAPSWDCGWYWGFGYVETYTNNKNPERAKDISSHTHIDSIFKLDKNIYHSDFLIQKTFSESEGLELTKLFKEFYSVKRNAQNAHRASDNQLAKELNEIILPEIMDKIIQILQK